MSTTMIQNGETTGIYEFRLADIGEGVHTATIARWLVEKGQKVALDEPLVLVETDKVTAELPSPVAGEIVELAAPEGASLSVGEVLVKIRTHSKADDNALSKASTAETPPQATVSSMKADRMLGDVPQAQDTVNGSPMSGQTAMVRATPYVRKLARKLGVDLLTVVPTGKEGRITEADVLHTSQLSEQTGQEKSKLNLQQQATSVPREERIPFTGIRKKIAEHMVHSVRTIPHVTHSDEIEMDAISDIWQKAKKAAASQEIRLTLLAFMAKAVALAIREYPYINSSIDEEKNEIVLKSYVNLGIATDTDAGLLVPVVKGVENLSVLEIAQQIQSLTEKARTGKLGLGDTAGGTFTISNMGGIGSQHATPIIRHPEAAILALHRMEPRVVVRDGEMVIRKMMNVSLSFDHRLLDGATAVRFTNRVKQLLEEPEHWLLNLR
ncbi:dihydrolipoamide acetyltransferase family protein [Alicyclobacillus tolerans]|uniref:dihydrolipoamide acetyltransferase family protein n=1 Tax=Alicyclobacillus tolerans TaxID=90970 RepID=UPI003B7764B8